MKITVLTEGGKDIGFGHTARCLALVEALESLNHKADTRFFISGDNSVEVVLKGKKYTILDWRNENELPKLVRDSTMVIIDSYMADPEVYRKISEITYSPVYIDDTNRVNYPAGTVVNGMVYADKLNYPKSKNVTYLLGQRYAILRKEFWNAPGKVIMETLESVAIIFGGDDKRNLTPKILKFLNSKYPALIKNVIISGGFRNKKEIEALKNDKTSFIYSPNAEMIKDTFLKSDLAISAGGQTLQELARIGIPTIGICVADNQQMNLENWESSGFLEYIGWYHDKDLLKRLENAMSNLSRVDERRKRSRIAKSLIDGKGAERICVFLLKKEKAI